MMTAPAPAWFARAGERFTISSAHEDLYRDGAIARVMPLTPGPKNALETNGLHLEVISCFH
jgi:hypothetical protein